MVNVFPQPVAIATNNRVLVLCPKRLRDNWTIYKANDKRNILAGDRLNYDVLNHTDLSRDTRREAEAAGGHRACTRNRVFPGPAGLLHGDGGLG